MVDIIREAIERIYIHKSVYFKRIASTIASIAVVIILQCISFNVVEQFSEKNIRKRDKVTIEVINKERNVSDNELLDPFEVTKIVNKNGDSMRIMSEEWEEAIIYKVCNSYKIQITAATRGYIIQCEEKIVEGRSFDKIDEEYGSQRVIIPEDLSKRLFGSESAVGRKLQFTTQEHGMLEVEVIGVYEVESYNENNLEVNSYDIYINYDYIKKNNMIKDEKTEILEYFINIAEINSVKKNLHRYLDLRYKKTDSSITVRSELDELDSSNRIIELIIKVIQLFATLAFVIGNLGIMNLSLLDIEKRIKEIGIRMAVGAESKHIIIQIMSECIFLSFVGTIGGIIVGFLFGSSVNIFICIKYKDILSSFEFYMPWKVAICSSIGSLIISLIFSIIPAKKASDIVVIEAIKMKD